MEIIIEQVSRSQKLLQRHKVKGSRVTIGRGFDNDIVLTDPYVCAHHLSLAIDDNARWHIEDQASINGIFDDQQKAILGCQPIRSGDVVSIGKSYLRFIYPNQAVVPAIRLSGLEGVLNWLTSPLIVMMIFCSYMGLLLVNYYLDSASEIKTTQMFSSVFANFVAVSLLPLLFALLARLFKHDARVLTQMVVCYSFSILFVLFDDVIDVISFNSNLLWFNSFISYAVKACLVFSLIWASCYVAFHQSSVRRTIVAGCVTFGIFTMGYLYNGSLSRDFNPKPRYDNTLLAPEFAFSTPVSIKAFIADSESVFDISSKKANKNSTEQIQ